MEPNWASKANRQPATTRNDRIRELERHDARSIHRKIEEWREWKEKVEDYLETVKSGMREILEEAEAEAATITKDWTSCKNARMGGERNTPLWLL